jgi:hypothetical protein
MNKFTKCFAFSASLFSLILVNTGNALDLKNQKPLDAMGKRNQNSVSTPLSEKECVELGGTVSPSRGLCKSKSYCATIDQNGEKHRVCISKN